METTTGNITDVFYQKELELIGVAGRRGELGKLHISNRGLVRLSSFNSGNGTLGVPKNANFAYRHRPGLPRHSFWSYTIQIHATPILG